jgi:HIV-1 Vpr-binding protein
MRDPILQEKRQEHVTFQKYALELLERLSGKTKHRGNDLEVSLANIHRANVVAQTKIQFNDRQLLQLIHQHLISKGFPETAASLVKEANLGNSVTQLSAHQPTKFRYSSTLTPSRHRALPSPVIQKEETTVINGANANSPAIKLIKWVFHTIS